MNGKEHIKKKIKSLLAKNVENGATEQEAISALQMANKLMQKYFIAEKDLNDPFGGEKCIFVDTPIIKSGYGLDIFYNALAKLFDCEYFYDSKTITFYGFQQDAELCGYFYSLIVRSALQEKDKYMHSKEAIELKNYYHGRTIAASFLQGFLERIEEKMKELYKEKQSNNQSYGLFLDKKTQQVMEQFSNQNIKVKIIRKTFNDWRGNKGFDRGKEVGEKFHITQGVNEYKQEKSNIKLLK